MSWTTGGVCNDLVNNTKDSCEAQPDRLWNPGKAICSIIMMGDDRNNVVCAAHGGNWVTAGTCTGSWVNGARTAYTPNLLTGNSAGDQCLRCHNDVTQYNGPRVRDTEETIMMGHKNMVRKVTVGPPWGGPPFNCSDPTYTNEEDCVHNGGTWDPTIYPATDGGNTFNWTNGTVDVGGVDRDLLWIYGDWLAALPRAVYKAPASTTSVCTDPRYTTQATCEANSGTWVLTAGASYSCGRCHATGWTSDAAIKTAKEPEASFPGITWDRLSHAPANVVNLTGGVTGSPNKYSSWDQWGITCSRCHDSVVDTNLVACTGLSQATCTTLGGTWSSSSSTCSNITPTQCTDNSGTIANYVAATGMSSHHNNLTVPDISGGTCTNTWYTAETQCTTNGGSWLTACDVNPTAGICTMAANTSAKCSAVSGTWTAVTAFCSNARYTVQADCTANGFTWTDGYCTSVAVEAACTGGAGDAAKTWRRNGTQQSCLLAGATWSFSKCSVEGLCNKKDGLGADITNKADCTSAGGEFAYATDVIRCEDAGGHWTGNNSNRGPIITSVCAQCHRQETGGLPYGATSTDGINIDYTATDPAGQL